MYLLLVRPLAASLFKFPDYLSPKSTSVIGHIYNNNTEAVCGFLFPTKTHANYNNGCLIDFKGQQKFTADPIF